MATVQGTLPFVESKRCTKCGVEKPATVEFFGPAKSIVGLVAACRECSRAAYKNYFLRNRDKVREAIRKRDKAYQPERSRRAKEKRKADSELVRAMDKVYAARRKLPKGDVEEAAAKLAARQEEARREFEAHRRALLERRDTRPAKVRESERRRKRREKDPERARYLNREKRKRSIDRIRKYQRERGKRRDVRDKQNAWAKKKRQTDATYRISECMSSAIWQSIKGKKNRQRWQQMVGYTIDDLKRHLESKFLPGMTWENHGKFGWHIDHIRPIASFRFQSESDPEFLECWGLKNLQPLWWRDNLTKKDKVTHGDSDSSHGWPPRTAKH